MKEKRAFTIIELVMIIVVVGILAAIAIPRFIGLQNDAREAANLGVIGALRSASEIYYSRSMIQECLCIANGDPGSCNTYRSITVTSPCYPANIQELESLLTTSPEWDDQGWCYDSGTGNIIACP